MDTKLLQKVEKSQMRKDLPKFEVGDTIAVHTILREKEKTRVQIFKGIVLAIKGSGLRTTFTIRKISLGVGVEKILPLYSPNIKKIDFIKKGKVRRSKIYYMRKRIGKRAVKITEGALKKSMKKQHDDLKELEHKERKADIQPKKPDQIKKYRDIKT